MLVLLMYYLVYEVGYVKDQGDIVVVEDGEVVDFVEVIEYFV